MSDKLHRIEGVEIFRTGTWNDDTFTSADLDEIVENFGKVGYRAPVTLGHVRDPVLPAHGWVEKVRRVGDRLLADFCDVPAAIYNAIKSRAFDTVSAEIFWNLKRNGKTFRRALRAVALLGADVPAVDLRPIHQTARLSLPKGDVRKVDFPVPELRRFPGLLEATARRVRDELPNLTAAEAGRRLHERVNERMARGENYATALRDALAADHALRSAYAATTPAPDPDNFETPAAAGADLDKEVRALQRDNPSLDYAAAFHLVTRDPLMRDTVATYAAVDDTAPRAAAFAGGAGSEVDRRVRELQARNPKLDYPTAMRAVLAADADLRRQYAQAE